MTAIPAALAFARRLDALLPSADDALSDLLSFDVGELLGGLGAQGFAADLETAMRAASDEIATWRADDELGDDGRAFLSYTTEQAGDEAAERVAAEWLRDATALLSPSTAWSALASMTSAADVRGVLTMEAA